MSLKDVKYRDVARVLKSFGFVLQPKKATGHEKWIREHNNRKYVVTVSKHSAPFSHYLMSFMIEQSKIKKSVWLCCLRDKKYKLKDENKRKFFKV